VALAFLFLLDLSCVSGLSRGESLVSKLNPLNDAYGESKDDPDLGPFTAVRMPEIAAESNAQLDETYTYEIWREDQPEQKRKDLLAVERGRFEWEVTFGPMASQKHYGKTPLFLTDSSQLTLGNGFALYLCSESKSKEFVSDQGPACEGYSGAAMGCTAPRTTWEETTRLLRCRLLDGQLVYTTISPNEAVANYQTACSNLANVSTLVKNFVSYNISNSVSNQTVVRMNSTRLPAYDRELGRIYAQPGISTDGSRRKPLCVDLITEKIFQMSDLDAPAFFQARGNYGYEDCNWADGTPRGRLLGFLGAALTEPPQAYCWSNREQYDKETWIGKPTISVERVKDFYMHGLHVTLEVLEKADDSGDYWRSVLACSAVVDEQPGIPEKILQSFTLQRSGAVSWHRAPVISASKVYAKLVQQPIFCCLNCFINGLLQVVPLIIAVSISILLATHCMLVQ